MDEPQLTPHRLLRADGLSFADIRTMQRGGELHRVRRGVYRRVEPNGESAEQRHRVLVRATWSELAGGAVVSHLSAAIMHGLPVLAAPPPRVTVTKVAGGHGRADSVLHLKLCPIGDDETCLVDGVVVTSLARTVVDVARTCGIDQGVAAADAALRAGLDRAELSDCVDRARGRPGIGTARRVAVFADPAADSPGESVSRVRMQQAGLPAPVLQWRLGYPDGRDTYSDFGWPDLRTLGEFDGRIKYGRLLRAGQTPTDVVLAEKRRENRIRGQGWWLVRWGWSDLADVHAFGQLIRQGFDNAPRMV